MIVATAGHVDHGKTALVKMLSGVDTDRLPEEKQRGLTVDLGFAYIPHASGEGGSIGFVDVPGHEKFVRNMIAGVGSISIALLVVAADDGLMPQTVEHLSILKLLGVQKVTPVVTKIDLVSAERIAELKHILTEFLKSHGYQADRVFTVTTQRHESVDDLRCYLMDQLQQSGAHDVSQYFRLAVDRCFSISGAGTVVTGTVLSGTIKREEEVYLVGASLPLRVRELRTQGVESDSSRAGQRCALNIAGTSLRRRMPARGDILSNNPTLITSNLLDARVIAVDSRLPNESYGQTKVLKHWTPCHLHIATSSTPCRVALLQTESLSVGQSGFARLYCDKPVHAVAGDRFVLRDQSARLTIAGGYIVDPDAPARGRSSAQRLVTLKSMDHRDPALALCQLIDSTTAGVDVDAFVLRYNCTPAEVESYVKSMTNVQHEGSWIIRDDHWHALQGRMLDGLSLWHQDNPLLLGASVDQLIRGLKPAVHAQLAAAVLSNLMLDQKVVKKGAVYRLQSWSSKLDDEHESRWQRIEPLFTASGRVAPRVVEIADSMNMPAADVIKTLNTFVAHGRLFRVSNNRYYLPQQLLELARLGESLASKHLLTVAGYRDASGIGRNLVVELLEFFDRCQFTRRIGQERTVINSAESIFT